METRISVDGRVTRPGEAVVPVLDRGFLYGDSVYEVMWWHHGVLIQQAEHFERLRESGERLYMEVPFSDEALAEAVHRTCAAAGAQDEDDAYVRLVVTRGAGPIGLEIVPGARPCLVVIVAPAHRPGPDRFEAGISVAVVERRRNPRLALDPRAKTGNYLNNLLALHEARLAGADDAVMLNERGEVTEGTTSNVFLVRGRRIVTPPLEAGILKGTSRTRLLGLAGGLGLEGVEEMVRRADLLGADEVFLSSSVKGVRPVVRIDGERIGDGRPGPWTRRCRDAFEAAADKEAAAARALRPGPPEAV